MTHDELEAAAKKMADILHSDSHIPQKASVRAIRKAMSLDGIPTEEEMVLMVDGDEDGESLEELQEKYPNIDAAIAAFF